MSLVDPSMNLIMDCGQVGELVVRIGLLVTMLRTPWENEAVLSGMTGMLYAPRSVFQLVKQLAGEEVSNKLKADRTDLDCALCCFNHFQASDELDSPKA